MSIATEVHKILTENKTSAFSLYAGYGMKDAGERVSFPTGIIKKERRVDGRIVSCECHYSDGSYIKYTYSIAKETHTLKAVR